MSKNLQLQSTQLGKPYYCFQPRYWVMSFIIHRHGRHCWPKIGSSRGLARTYLLRMLCSQDYFVAWNNSRLLCKLTTKETATEVQMKIRDWITENVLVIVSQSSSWRSRSSSASLAGWWLRGKWPTTTKPITAFATYVDFKRVTDRTQLGILLQWSGSNSLKLGKLRLTLPRKTEYCLGF